MSNHGTFPYNPFSYVNQRRQNELRDRTVSLVRARVRTYLEKGGKSSRALNYYEIGNILYEISRNAIYGINTDEKAVSWCFVVAELRDSNHLVKNDGLIAGNIDTLNTGVNWGHIIVSFADPRHGTVGGRDSYTDGTLADAEREIDNYERQLGGIRVWFRNDGDATASMNTVRTMFAFRSGGFAAFARTWNELFLGRTRHPV